MKKIRIRRDVCLCVLFACSVIWISPALGEETLVNGDAKHLGWRVAKNKFTTCSQDVVAIGNGRISNTDKKCPRQGVARPVLTSGKVVYVDIKNRAFEVKDKSGKLHDVFYPVRAEVNPSAPMEDLEIGNEVLVWGPVRGRADKIVILEEDESCES